MKHTREEQVEIGKNVRQLMKNPANWVVQPVQDDAGQWHWSLCGHDHTVRVNSAMTHKFTAQIRLISLELTTGLGYYDHPQEAVDMVVDLARRHLSDIIIIVERAEKLVDKWPA